jgi:hypothetical protein
MNSSGFFLASSLALFTALVLGNQSLGAIEHLFAVLALGVHVRHP